MVVASEQVELYAGRAHPARCSKRRPGRIARCLLAPGHAGHHQARVTVRRTGGESASYVYYWLT